MGTAPVQSMAAMLATTIDQMAGPGAPRRFTRRKKPAKGTPLSRANEYTARDAEVTHESPQNHMAMEASAAIAFPTRAPSAVSRIAIAAGTALPCASLAESTAGM